MEMMLEGVDMDEVVDKDVEMGCEVVGVLMELVLVCYITIYLIYAYQFDQMLF